MVSLAVKETNLFSETQYISVEDALNSFEFLPKSIYIRGEIDTSENTVSEYQANLVFPDGKKSIVRVIDPFVWFSLDDDQIKNLGLTDVKPGVKYLLNGNNRFYAVSQLYNSEAKDTEFALIPNIELNADNITFDLLTSLQVKYNDTTKPHSTLSKMLAIGKLYNRYIEQGMKSSHANSAVRSVMGVVESYVSQAKKFTEALSTIENESVSKEKRDELSLLFDLVSKDYFSTDVALNIMQTSEVLGLNIYFIIENVIAAYGGKVEDGKIVPISKNQFTNWRKDYEKRVKDASSDPLSDLTEPSDVVTEDTKSDKKDKAEPTQNEIYEATSAIKSGARVITAGLELDGQNPEYQMVFQRSLTALISATQLLLNKAAEATPAQTYEQVAKVTLGLMSNDSIMQLLDPSEKIKLATLVDRAQKEVSKAFLQQELNEPQERTISEIVDEYPEEEEFINTDSQEVEIVDM